MGPKKKIAVWGTVIFFVLGAAFRIAQKTGKKAKAVNTEIVPVTIVSPLSGTIEDLLSLPGDVRGVSEAKVYSKVPGKLQQKVKDVGDFVSKDETVALVDRDEPALDFKLSEVNAPLNGVVTQYFLDIGEAVTLQSPLFEVASIERVKVVVNATEKDMPRIRKGQPVRFIADAYPDRVFRGMVSRISQSIDLQSRTIPVEIEVPNPGHLLKPGLFAKAEIVLAVHQGSLSLPIDAVAEYDSMKYVYVIREGIAYRQAVETGIVEDSRIEIRKGITSSDKVVKVGWQNLTEGAKVEVQE